MGKNKSMKEALHLKNVLITGGLGMLGSLVARELVKFKAKVTILDACLKPYGANMFNLNGIEDKCELHIGDIRDKKMVSALMKGKDIVFNLAGQVSHNDSLTDPFLDADINYMGHLNVLENAKKYNPNVKILFSGSRLQFGRIRSLPVNEDHPLMPETPYALNKTSAEMMYKYYYRMYGIKCVIFRIANPYGINCQMKHSKYSILNYFLKKAMNNEEILIFGDGEQIRDYIYNKDLVDAFMSAAVSKEADGEIFNVGSGEGTKFKDMVNLVVKVAGKGKVKQVEWPENYINVETGDYVSDISKIHQMLDWRPKISMKEGVQETYRYYAKYGKHYF